MKQIASAGGGRFDVVVIGSGFGGAAVACRLAQAGRSVAILERGPDYPLQQGNWKTTEQGRRGFRHGHFIVDKGNGMNVIRGIGVGGGSLHYFNVRIRPDPVVFETPRWPRKVNRNTLDPYFDLGATMLGARPAKPNPVAGMPYRGTLFHAAARSCRRATSEPIWVPLAVHFDEEPRPTPAGVPLTRCVYCGDCLLGCPSSASFDGNVNARERLTNNYLAVAKKHGARVFPEHYVQEIRKNGESFEVVFTLGDDPESGVPVALPTETVTAKEVVVAAGTMGSNEVLLKSRHNFPGMSPMLGRNFSGNGDFINPRTAGTPIDMQPKSGPSIVAGANFNTKDHHILFEDLGALPILEDIMARMTAEALRDKLHGDPSDQTEAPPTAAEKALEKAPGQAEPSGRYDMRYLGMGTDAGNGVLSLKDNAVYLDWDPKESLPLYEAYEAILREMSQQLNGEYEPPPGFDPATGTGTLTAHPLGGCVMSDGPDTGVVDTEGKVWGVPGLYVADGAIVPGPVATNPSYTITALAERVAFWMIHGREMTEDDKDAPANT